MFDYLQQFNQLPKELKAKVSSPAIMTAISALEAKYGVDLAVLVMKAMVKAVDVNNLPLYLASEFSLSREQAENLAQDLKSKVFSQAATYLGLTKDLQALDLDDDLQEIMKAAGLNFPSADLAARFRQILNTYLRGVRSKIDTRSVLNKSVVAGGLNLDGFTIDKIFKACESISLNKATPPLVKAPASASLDKLMIGEAAAGAIAGESAYNLKDAVAHHQLKKLDLSHEIAAPAPELDLPKPLEKVLIAEPKPVVTPQVVLEEKPILREIKPELKNIVAKPASLKTVTPPAPVPSPAIVRPTAPAASLRPQPLPGGRPQMSDIKAVPKVMGPIEELQFLDLINFRRLGANPQEICTKIYNKIKLLEKSGYDKMIMGVVAWRKSIINRLYVKMCQEAFAKEITLQQVIKLRQDEKREGLNWDEILAILDLNNKLMF